MKQVDIFYDLEKCEIFNNDIFLGDTDSLIHNMILDLFKQEGKGYKWESSSNKAIRPIYKVGNKKTLLDKLITLLDVRKISTRHPIRDWCDVIFKLKGYSNDDLSNFTLYVNYLGKIVSISKVYNHALDEIIYTVKDKNGDLTTDERFYFLMHIININY